MRYSDHDVHTAMEMCILAHKYQIDRDGNPHSFHCFRVATRQDTNEGRVLGLLHDLKEDCSYSWFDRAKTHFGPSMSQCIDVLTRDFEHMDKDKYLTHITTISKVPICAKVKLADLEDKFIKPRFDEKVKKYEDIYRESMRILDEAIAGHHLNNLPWK